MNVSESGGRAQRTLFSFGLPPLHFPGLGLGGSRDASGPILSAEPFLVYMRVSRDGERGRLFSYARSAISFSRTGAGRWGFWRLSTLGSGAIGMHARGSQG